MSPPRPNTVQSRLRAGLRLGDRYELLTEWAKGGMASVWLARVRGTHGFAKLFAVKTMLPEFAQDAGFRDMFLDEARIVAQVRHVNVATIEDMGEHEGLPFMVFEWIQGDTWSRLADAIATANAPTPVDIMLRIGAQAAGGLHAAHELRDGAGASLRVVHRDVSPQNIMVTESGVAKVIDFGIAKAKGRIAEATQTGLVKGKLDYAAPEQVISRSRVDRRTDTYGLGAVLYHVLTGEVVNDGVNDAQRLIKIGSAQPPTRPANVPPAVADMLMRALDPDPSRRFQTALELERALEACLSSPTSMDDVGQCMGAFLGPRAAERRGKIRTALEQADASEGPPSWQGRARMATIPPEAAGAASFRSHSELPEEPSRTVLPTIVAPRWLWAALALATLLAVGVWCRVVMLAWEMKHASTEVHTSSIAMGGHA